MKSFAFTFYFFIFINLIHSQSDSLRFVTAEWKTEDVAEGVVWKSFHFKDSFLFNANLNINFIEFKHYQSAYKLKVVASDSLELTSELAQKNDALAAINGSFFRTNAEDRKYPDKIGKNRSLVYLRINGIKITDNVPSKNNKRKVFQKGSIVTQNDEVLILKSNSMIDWEESIDGQDMLTSGPLLLNKGLIEPAEDNAFNKNRHPRTAIGKKANGDIILFVVDGRSSESYGLTIPELQACMKWMGCADALNLDGGGSSTMVIEGKDYNGVVNCPSDNKVFDHEGERAVANAILILKKDLLIHSY